MELGWGQALRAPRGPGRPLLGGTVGARDSAGPARLRGPTETGVPAGPGRDGADRMPRGGPAFFDAVVIRPDGPPALPFAGDGRRRAWPGVPWAVCATAPRTGTVQLDQEREGCARQW